MRFDPDNPYNDLPLLPPQAELETKAVLRKAIAANKALGGAEGRWELIPNQGVLINAKVLQEGKLSSEIQMLRRRTTSLTGHSATSICSRNEHMVRICRKKPGF